MYLVTATLALFDHFTRLNGEKININNAKVVCG